METFEFLNVLQVHGFPKLLGVLTHLDQFESISAMRKRKKQLKKRFWEDVYDGAKLFYFSGLMHHKWYPRNEVINLARFISVQRFRPLTWRNQHPYILVDRMEDVTHPGLFCFLLFYDVILKTFDFFFIKKNYRNHS